MCVAILLNLCVPKQQICQLASSMGFYNNGHHLVKCGTDVHSLLPVVLEHVLDQGSEPRWQPAGLQVIAGACVGQTRQLSSGVSLLVHLAVQEGTNAPCQLKRQHASCPHTELLVVEGLVGAWPCRQNLRTLVSLVALPVHACKIRGRRESL